MNVRMVQDRLESYGAKSTLEEEQALREITQEIVLAALGRTDLFRRAAFMGGTCLRVFHGLNRFSEDLDFALKEPDSGFVLQPYLESVVSETAAYGFEMEVDDRSRRRRAVRFAFLKDDSVGRLLTLDHRPTTGPSRKIRIKLEVDVNPPAGAGFETRYLDFPFPSAVLAHDLPSLFAGKLHALLCREYEKGRDWYDFIWYTARGVTPNYRLLSSALDQLGPWPGQGLAVDREWCVAALRSKIEATNWESVRRDVQRFIRPDELPSLSVWSREFFLAQSEKLPPTA